MSYISDEERMDRRSICKIGKYIPVCTSSLEYFLDPHSSLVRCDASIATIVIVANTIEVALVLENLRCIDALVGKMVNVALLQFRCVDGR